MAALVRPAGYDANHWIRELASATDILSASEVTDAEAIDAVRQIYRRMYAGSRNFSDLLLWRDDE